MDKKNTGYTTKDVSDGRLFLSRESSCLAVAREKDIEAMEWAFRFGQKLWVDILKEKRGTRNQGVLKNYLKAVGFKNDNKTAYRYIALYRAAKTLKTIRNSGLSRTYLTMVGQTLWTDNLLFDDFAETLVTDPIRRKTETETLFMLNEACKVIKDARDRMKELKSLTVNICGKQGEESQRKVDGNIDEAVHLFQIYTQLEQDLARLTGRHIRTFTFIGPPGEFLVKTPDDIGDGRKAKGLILDAHRQDVIRDILGEASKSDLRDLEKRLIHGDALQVLKDKTLFPERSIDCVLTDPPYSDEDYEPEREHTRVKHQAPATTVEAAELAASVARSILDRKINRSRFCWIQFCPLRKIHVFLPALLRAFKDARCEPDFQVLVWDKCVPARVGGTDTFGSQAEAILYVNVGRPLPVEDANGSKIFSPIFKVQQPKAGGGLDPWKPVALLKQLLWLCLYGADKSEAAARQRVLDPFAGRGSTGIAAMELGRAYTLIEIDEDQHKIARANLLEAAKLQSKLPK